MFRRSRKKIIPSNNESLFYDAVIRTELSECEKRITKIFRPLEHRINFMQSILLWEYPLHTLYTIVSLNIIFWLATLIRFYHLVGLTGLFYHLYHTWTYLIWPEIKGEIAEKEEKWILVNPHYLSVSDWSHILATIYISFKQKIRWLLLLREVSHIKFTVLLSVILSSLAAIGSCISGIILLYSFVMSIFVLPALSHHNIIKRTNSFIAPYIYNIEEKFCVKRVKAKKRKNKVPFETASYDSDSDVELHEFVPTHESLTLIKLNCLDSDVESTGHTPQLHTPVSSLSAESSDGEIDNMEECDVEDDENYGSLLPKLRKMPGMDDTNLDESFDDAIETTLLAAITTEEDNTTNFELTFDDDVPEDHEPRIQKSHKKSRQNVRQRRETQSSDSDINEMDLLASGLDFSDPVEDEAAEGPGMFGRMANRLSYVSSTFQTIGSGVQTIGSGVQSIGYGAMFGMTKIDETYRYFRGTNKHNQNDVVDSENSQLKDQNFNQNKMIESTDDILEEFEFLNEDDLEI